MLSKFFRMCPAAAIGCLALVVTALAGDPPPDPARDALAAVVDPPEGWVAIEPPQIAAGNQLFTVIDGGAEMYVRLGFARAVFAAYRNSAGKSINLEVYQMKTAEAAGKVQAMKAGEEGRPVDFGDAARLADHYLNFNKGVYQVTISGYDTGRRTVAGLMTLAAWVDKRLAAP